MQTEIVKKSFNEYRLNFTGDGIDIYVVLDHDELCLLASQLKGMLNTWW